MEYISYEEVGEQQEDTQEKRIKNIGNFWSSGVALGSMSLKQYEEVTHAEIMRTENSNRELKQKMLMETDLQVGDIELLLRLKEAEEKAAKNAAQLALDNKRRVTLE